MGKITISADTPEEFFALVQSVFGVSIADAPAIAGTAAAAPTATTVPPDPAKPAGRGTRKRAEAPPPLQPGAQAPPSAAPAPLTHQPVPLQAPGQRLNGPTGEQTFGATPFMPPQPQPPQAPNVVQFTAPNGQQPQPPADRPSVAKLRGHIGALVNAWGEPHVYQWLQRAFGLPNQITLNDFMQNAIHNIDDSKLEEAYQMSGGR